MKLSGPPTTSDLPESLLHALNMYALAATAAGVGMLALVPQAAGKIIYTKAHKVVRYNDGPIFFDLNNDGVNDFALSGESMGTTSGAHANLNVYAAHRGNAVWSVQSQGHHCAAAVYAGQFIGPKRKFSPNELVMFFLNTFLGSGSAFCPWINKPIAYLGLRVEINGKEHYGWARISFFGDATTLTGYAYETIPNKAIVADQTRGPANEENLDSTAPLASSTLETPSPASLGALAMGAPALSIWRRRAFADESNYGGLNPEDGDSACTDSESFIALQSLA
jgi:hypothetical protein